MIRDHIHRRGDEKVNPTVKMLRYWWGKLNVELFDGELAEPKLTYGKSRIEEPVFGLCYAMSDGTSHIHIDRRVTTRAMMLCVLAHEMVHQYQHENDIPMTHGNVFPMWAQTIRRKTGLTI